MKGAQGVGFCVLGSEVYGLCSGPGRHIKSRLEGTSDRNHPCRPFVGALLVGMPIFAVGTSQHGFHTGVQGLVSGKSSCFYSLLECRGGGTHNHFLIKSPSPKKTPAPATRKCSSDSLSVIKLPGKFLNGVSSVRGWTRQ